jgi:hypothetical protein
VVLIYGTFSRTCTAQLSSFGEDRAGSASASLTEVSPIKDPGPALVSVALPDRG